MLAVTLAAVHLFQLNLVARSGSYHTSVTSQSGAAFWHSTSASDSLLVLQCALQLDDSAPGMLSELMIVLTIANQLFEQSSLMSPDAQVSLMLALSEVSSRTLAAAQQAGFAAVATPGPAGTPLGGSMGGVGPTAGPAVGASGGGMKLTALNRMVEVLLFNLPRIQVCCRGSRASLNWACHLAVALSAVAYAVCCWKTFMIPVAMASFQSAPAWYNSILC